MSLDDARLHEVLRQLLDLPPSDRRPWLESAFPDDAPLRDRMLAAVDDATHGAPPGYEVSFDAGSVGLEPSIPNQIGRYQIIRRLGSGGMGSVFLAKDPKIDRDVALKLLHDDRAPVELRKRFLREAQAAGRLRHENIVVVYDTGEAHDQPFMAMEYVPGVSLFDLLHDHSATPLVRKLEIIEQICAGLACAHDAGIVHRDIKPTNLIVDERGKLTIVDFGIAKGLNADVLPGPRLTATDALVGTSGYIAPEVLLGQPADARSDIFSTAVVAYELLTSRKPFGEDSREIARNILSGDINGIMAAADDIPTALQPILAKGLASQPAQRFESIRTMGQAITRVRTQLIRTREERPLHFGNREVSTAADERHGPNDDSGATRSFLRPAVAVGAVLVIAVLVGIFATRPRQAKAVAPATAQPVAANETPQSDPVQSGVAPAPATGRADTTPQTVRQTSPPSQPAKKQSTSLGDSGRPTLGATPPPIPSPTPVPDVKAPTQATIVPPQSTATPMPPAVSQPAFVAPAAPAPLNPRPTLDEAGIRDVLQTFETAFENQSTATLKSIYPSLTTEQLSTWDRSFVDNASYRMQIIGERLSPISDVRARVDCTLVQNLVPKRGGEPRRLTNQVTIVLDKVQIGWVITSIRGPGWQ